jgi:hypothetical protein
MHQTHLQMISKFIFNGCRAWSQAIMYCKMQSSHTRNINEPFSVNPKSVATRARSKAIIQLRDALLLYAKHISHFTLNPNSVATRARSPAIMQLRDTLLSYAKHIGHFTLNPNSVATGARSQAIMQL